MTLEATRITSTVAPYDLVRKMRASILVLGPMLARAGEATVSLPGGCAIGNRPIDLHLKALEAFGAKIELAPVMSARLPPMAGCPAATTSFPVVSVGATENALMAAVLCTRHQPCCTTPRASRRSLTCATCWSPWARRSKGSALRDLVTVHGVQRLHGATYMVMPDRIEAGSYACAAAITGGDSVRLEGARRRGR